MLEFLAVAVAGLLLLVLVGTAAWRLYRRLRRSRLVSTAGAVVSGCAMFLAACRPATSGNRTAAYHALRLARAQWALRQRVAAALRAGAYLGEIPAMLPRLHAETHRICVGLGRLPSAATPAGRDLLAAAGRHLATITDLSDAVATALGLPAAEGTLRQEAEEAARGLRLYAAAYTELVGNPTRADVLQRVAV